MKIGFIGAGKVGFTLGKYFSINGIEVSGYFSKNPESAKSAAQFTNSQFYGTINDLIRDSEVIFITVPDGEISTVWEQIKTLGMRDRLFCHCSGAMSSTVFSDITDFDCYGYSVHPFFAVSDKLESYKELSHALFTIEGPVEKREKVADILKKCDNQVVFIDADSKVRYHMAAVFASNLVNGLMETAITELVKCGFETDDAKNALLGLALNNLNHLYDKQLEDILTGPVERCDTGTVKKHLENITGDSREIYTLLSKKVLDIAKRKNPERDYLEMEELLNG